MPVTIQVDNHPVGISVSYGHAGEMVQIRPTEFTSSEDGDEFVVRLEGLGNCYRDAFIQSGVAESQVSTFLAIARPDKTATVYINELQDSTGTPIQIPNDCGVSLVLSHRWRKGYFFDYSVFGPHGLPRTSTLPKLFGHLLARIIFQEIYSASDTQWGRLYELGWFPFVGLKAEDRRTLLSWAKNDRMAPSVLDTAARNFVASLDQRLAIWATRDHLEQRMPFLNRAKERLDAGDYLSCINVLFPQIEGVMRGCFVEQKPTGRPKQDGMVDTVTALQPNHSMLLPVRFSEYLKQVYFRDFSERVGNLPLSRHTVSHGVSNPADYDFQRAAVGFMVLDQLFFYLCDRPAMTSVTTDQTASEGGDPATEKPTEASL